MLGVQKGQPAGLRLLDDRDLDAVDHRQSLARQLLRDLLGHRVVGRRFGVVAHFAEVGVALEHHARGPLPFGQHIGPGAHRVLHDLVAVLLDHLARHRRGAGEVADEARARLAERDAVGVAVERAQAGNLGVVVERLALLHRLLAQLVQTQDLLVGEAGVARAFPARVEDSLERVHIVGGDQLALLAVERRVVGEIDAGLDAHGEGLEVGRDLGHLGSRLQLELHRPREVVVGQWRFEDVRGDGGRVEVRDLHRIEAGLGHREGVAQDLLRGCRGCGSAVGSCVQRARGCEKRQHQGHRERQTPGRRKMPSVGQTHRGRQAHQPTPALRIGSFRCVANRRPLPIQGHHACSIRGDLLPGSFKAPTSWSLPAGPACSVALQSRARRSGCGAVKAQRSRGHLPAAACSTSP